MSQYPTATRQTPRLQNTSKTSLGSGSSWGYGLPSASATNGSSNFNGNGLGNGIGSAPGFGLTSSRPAQLSGFAQVMGGGGNSSIDMSDFPSLSGGPQPAAHAAQSNWSGSNILRSQQQPQPAQRVNQQAQSPANQATLLQQSQRWSPSSKAQSSDQQAQDQESNGGSDFPPLSGHPTANGDVYASARSPEQIQQSVNGLISSRTTTLPFRDSPIQHAVHTQAPIGRPQTQSQMTVTNAQTLSNNAPSPAVKRYADMTEKEKYGLEGLAAAYEARKAIESGQPVDETLPAIMRSGLFFGQDLNSLGMDLDSPEPIWPTFTAFPASTSQAQGASGTANGTFDFHDRAIVPEFTLPQAYTVTNVPVLAGRLGSLSDETLFCIFYQNPRDLLQEQAAQELTARDWRWHKVLRQWLQKDSQHSAASNNAAGGGNTSLPILDLTNGAPVGVQPQRVSAGVERGVYVFFDVMNWRRERREFVLAYDELDQRFTPSLGMIGGAQGGAAGSVGASIGIGGPVLPPGREGIAGV